MAELPFMENPTPGYAYPPQATEAFQHNNDMYRAASRRWISSCRLRSQGLATLAVARTTSSPMA
ncbi:hypothetical protein AURDEDRAFT_115277 [Auricularia subglabra TFB-10046 SS5]|nr:hypothetical protein AURDEDRAFT_115277 [Auricularia subglabra TFB-10046 SS5]